MQKEFDERLVVQAVLSGNRDAFVQLIKQYEGLVLHIVTPLVGTGANREDICQDIFVKVYEKLYSFRFQSKLGTWIGNIAYNTSINFLRKKKHVVLSDLVAAEDEFGFLTNGGRDLNDPEQMVIKRQDIERLNNAIDRLTVLQRAVILLFYQDELSLEEIATVLEMPVNTVKSHLSRGRNALKEIMNKTDKV